MKAVGLDWAGDTNTVDEEDGCGRVKLRVGDGISACCDELASARLALLSIWPLLQGAEIRPIPSALPELLSSSGVSIDMLRRREGV